MKKLPSKIPVTTKPVLERACDDVHTTRKLRDVEEI